MASKLPLYAATIEDINDGIYVISLVDEPATETQWQCFSKEQKPIEFAIENEEQHIIASVVMLADTPIYRRNSDGYEYNIIYHKDTIKLMAEKMLSDGTHNNIDIQHNGEILDKGLVQLVELFIKDEVNGINPSYLDVPDGSLIAKYKIHNEELWQCCKNGTLNGISLAGYFNVEQEQFKAIQKYNKPKNMLKKVKTALMSLLLQYSEVKTDNGILYYEGEELVEGIIVTDENNEPVADGDYTLEDGTVVTIKESKVEKITEPVAEDTPEDKPAEEVNAEGETKDTPEDKPAEETKEDEGKDNKELEDENTLTAEVEALKDEIKTIKGVIETLQEEIKKIAEAPAAAPVAEEFKNVTEVKENKAAKIASYLNK